MFPAEVDVRHPQEQGLKLILIAARARSTIGVDVRHPQEQGLKHDATRHRYKLIVAVDVRHPQEQGLKPSRNWVQAARFPKSTSVIHKNKD